MPSSRTLSPVCSLTCSTEHAAFGAGAGNGGARSAAHIAAPHNNRPAAEIATRLRGRLINGYAFIKPVRSASVFALASGSNPSSSSGAPERFTQHVHKPAAFAPITSQELEETKPIADAATPIFWDANS